VSVQQKVKVTVVEVDIPRKRIALSMKSNPFGAAPQKDNKKEHKKTNRREQDSEGGTMEEKLAALKNKFKKS
jgi:uncharacterized protein